MCPPFRTFLPRKRYWPPLQSPPTATIQEYWFSSVLFANFYDYPRNNYRNDFPKFPPPFSIYVTYRFLVETSTNYIFTEVDSRLDASSNNIVRKSYAILLITLILISITFIENIILIKIHNLIKIWLYWSHLCFIGNVWEIWNIVCI